MTEFVGPRDGWDEHAAGTVRFELDIELWSRSERAKHVDLTEQGGHLVEVIRRAIAEGLRATPDVAVHSLRYYGEVEPSTSNVTAEVDVGVRPSGEDDA